MHQTTNSPTNLADIPDDVAGCILSFVSIRRRGDIASLSKLWRRRAAEMTSLTYSLSPLGGDRERPPPAFADRVRDLVGRLELHTREHLRWSGKQIPPRVVPRAVDEDDAAWATRMEVATRTLAGGWQDAMQDLRFRDADLYVDQLRGAIGAAAAGASSGDSNGGCCGVVQDDFGALWSLADLAVCAVEWRALDMENWSDEPSWAVYMYRDAQDWREIPSCRLLTCLRVLLDTAGLGR